MPLKITINWCIAISTLVFVRHPLQCRNLKKCQYLHHKETSYCTYILLNLDRFHAQKVFMHTESKHKNWSSYMYLCANRFYAQQEFMHMVYVRSAHCFAYNSGVKLYESGNISINVWPKVNQGLVWVWLPERHLDLMLLYLYVCSWSVGGGDYFGAILIELCLD